MKHNDTHGVKASQAQSQTIQGYRVDASYFQKWESIPVHLRHLALALYAHPDGVGGNHGR